MRIIAKKSLKLFWESHPDSEQQLKAWYAKVKAAQWRTSSDVKNDLEIPVLWQIIVLYSTLKATNTV
jgi:mRNA-degrading endonuclease HigB of HigAB toxin-antitoxin module